MERSDSQDWADLIAGERTALARLYHAHAPQLLRYGRGFAGDEAVADALHTLFVRIWERRDRLPPGANPKAYLLIALRNELLRTLRLDRRVESDTDVPEFSDDDSIEYQLIRLERDQEKHAQLTSALATLSARERELVSLRFFQELDYERISEVTGISYQSARNVLARALAKLRERMGSFLLAAMGTAATWTTLVLEPPTHWVP